MTQTHIETMTYEVKESRNSVANDEWVVEAIDYAGDGEGYVALFSGQMARERAEEYGAWKNSGGGRSF